MKRRIIALAACLVAAIAAFGLQLERFATSSAKKAEEKESKKGNYEYYYNENSDASGGNNVKQVKKGAGEHIQVDTNPDSVTVLVNRAYPISADYVPADLVVPAVSFGFTGVCEKSYMRQIAATALEKMFQYAQKEGIKLQVMSAYRSYKRQQQIYNNNVSTRGSAQTDTVSAKPGTSEHQTGLAIDLSSESVGCKLDASFGESPEGKWVKKNCSKFGFILRYPKGKDGITGYTYEPWHIRYVGKNLAKYLKKNALTLEEYYKLTILDIGDEQYKVLQDSDTAGEEPQMTTAPTPNVTIKPTATPYYPQVQATPKQELLVTPTPVVTRAPSVTKAPAVTSQPEKTPLVTKSPKVTPKPAATKAPEPTKTPVATKRPVATKKPEPTKKPVVTKPPAATKEPLPEEEEE